MAIKKVYTSSMKDNKVFLPRFLPGQVVALNIGGHIKVSVIKYVTEATASGEQWNYTLEGFSCYEREITHVYSNTGYWLPVETYNSPVIPDQKTEILGKELFDSMTKEDEEEQKWLQKNLRKRITVTEG